MAFYFKHFVGIALICLVKNYMCTATIQSVATKFTGGKKLSTSYSTLEKISKIQCVERCNKDKQTGGCTLAGYNKATRSCYLSADDPQDVLDTTDEAYGVFFYEQDQTGTTTPPPTTTETPTTTAPQTSNAPQTTTSSGLTCATEEPLLDGTNPVPDSYFTASSYDTTFTEATVDAPKARMSADWCWSPHHDEMNAQPPTYYLQVRFQALSTVARVATKSCYTSSASFPSWVIQFRLAYSEDCVGFTNLLDSAGNNVTFPANTDQYNVVENQLPTPVTALCLRLYPLVFNNFADLKLEVYGCTFV